MNISNRRKKLLGSRFAGKYGLSYKEVDYFCEGFNPRTEKELNNALYIRFCIDSFADKEIPKNSYKGLYALNENHFGLPMEIVVREYKDFAEKLCKCDELFKFKDWDKDESELHQYALGKMHKTLQEVKKEHWDETKKAVHKEIYNKPLIE